MTRYVAGFMFGEGGRRVLLVRKNRPAWQAGLWNAVGGHIEAGEAPEEAMVREFREESGVEHHDWRHFATLVGAEFSVAFFAAQDGDALLRAGTVTDEPLAGFDVAQLPPTLPNLHWLIPMALHEPPDRGIPYMIVEYGV